METSALITIILLIIYVSFREYLHFLERKRFDADVRDLTLRIQSSNTDDYLRLKQDSEPENMVSIESDYVPLESVDIDELVSAVVGKEGLE